MHWHAYFTPGEHWWPMLVAESSFWFVLSICHFFFFILNCPYIPRSSMKTQFSLKWRFGSPIVNGLLIVPCGDITSDKWLLSLLNLIPPPPHQCFACTMLGSCKHKTSIQRVTQTTADCHHFCTSVSTEQLRCANFPALSGLLCGQQIPCNHTANFKDKVP